MLPGGPSEARTILRLLLESIQRLETSGTIKSKRLSAPDLAIWEHFRRKLGYQDLIGLLLEDAASLFPFPFQVLRTALALEIEALSGEESRDLINEVRTSLDENEDGQAFLTRAARELKRPHGGRLSELPRIQAYEKVLELPATGGRAAYYLSQHLDDIDFGNNFVFLTDGPVETLQVGLAAIESGAKNVSVISSRDLADEAAKGPQFDRVITLQGAPAPAVPLAPLARVGVVLA